MRQRDRAFAAVLILLLTTSLTAAEPVDFDRQIAPILVVRCLECHNENTASGSLVMTRHESLKKGGESGEVIVPGHSEESSLFEKVESGEMPPKRKGQSQRLSGEERAVLKAWIDSGAKWPNGRVIDRDELTTSVRGGRDWWAFQPIRRAEVPRPNRSKWVRNPIDAFVLARLENSSMKPAPEADRRTLIRRAYFDLIGLPPTAQEVDSFVVDRAPDAYEKLILRLLDSPHYGERWGRYWLDLARFAETSGYERDQEKPGAWRYRDWVVRAFNQDKPYDRFVVEQIAGDEVSGHDEDTVIGTGFLRLGTWNDEPNDPQEYKYERLEDLVQATTTAFLGLTVKCARCHDHKFDPIPQTDYYRVAATFWPGPIEPDKRELLGGPSKEQLGYDVLGWTDVRRQPPPLHLLKKGDQNRPAQVVPPGALSSVPSLDRPFTEPSAGAKTTQRRLQLAEWINDPRNPLTSRVYVNRLWQHHFGQGLVATPDNFGFTGQKPSHPELLDWLADEFLRGGRKTKPLHFLMMTSNVYRQASVHPEQEAYAQKDADNRLLWRASRRRQDAEALRDAVLAVSGRLDPRVGGPSFRPMISSEALEGLSMKGGGIEMSPAGEQSRRSLYMYSKRGLLAPIMTTFDFCDTTQPCGQRDVSVVAPQALALLNGEFAHEQSKATARRVIATSGQDENSRVETAWRIVLARLPSYPEREASFEHLKHQRSHFPGKSDADELALASLCHVLINSNEFMFVD